MRTCRASVPPEAQEAAPLLSALSGEEPRRRDFLRSLGHGQVIGCELRSG